MLTPAADDSSSRRFNTRAEKGLLAYDAADGKPVWNVATGPISYSSPQPVSLEGKSQVLFLSDHGLIALEPASGKLLWQHDAPGQGVWRATQPAAVGAASVLVGTEDLGTICLDLDDDNGTWTASQRWASKALKPAYNDFVVFDGCAYGFDGSIFCCLDLKTGKRRWKGGRYGHGQVLLLADQRLLVISSEMGEVVLLAADSDKHRELGRFQAIEGKTWNHPAIAQDCLYVRNDQEIACYRLPAASPLSNRLGCLEPTREPAGRRGTPTPQCRFSDRLLGARGTLTGRAPLPTFAIPFDRKISANPLLAGRRLNR